MPPRAIFLDMDDTILDTSGALEASWAATLDAYAGRLPDDRSALRAAIRQAAMDFWRDEAAVGHWRLDLDGARAEVVRRALTAQGLDPELARPIADRYGEEAFARLRLFDDTLATLDWLRSRGHRLGLLTNGPASLQRRKIARFDLERHFDVIVIEGVFGRGKPDPAVFEHALASTGTGAPDAWHVGDNLYADIGGARAVGIHAVWIHRERLELREDLPVVPDRVIGHLHELQAALEG
jgi:putative hydrolase of the HAD superfamily